MPSLRSSRVVLPDGVRPATIHHESGVVVAISDGPAEDDLADLVVLPGLVDAHVHVNEPGRTEWEGYATATMAAAAGGSTAIVDMPLNCIPPTVSVAALEQKRAAAARAINVDVAFWGGIVPGSEGEIDSLAAEGVCGFKVFLSDSGVPEYPNMPAGDLAGLSLDLPLLVHAEDPNSLLEPSGGSYEQYLASRPPEAEAEAIRSLAGLPYPVHVLHASSADAVEAVAEAGVSAETCPHYLSLTADDVTGPAFKCAPPIRHAEHREALWEGLFAGTLSMVVSDHSPSPPDMKEGDFASAWGGISSVQLRLPVTWTAASGRNVGFDRLADWLALAPARLAGLDDRKGSIEEGKDADFVIFDPEAEWTVSGANLYHRHPLTAYEGRRLRGQVVETILRGEVVFDGDNVRAGHGRMLARK